MPLPTADHRQGPIARGIGALADKLRARLYNPQITMAFPPDEVARRATSLPPLPPGFSLVVPRSEHEIAIWMELLSEEPSFGAWTRQRLDSEIIENLVSPTAISLLLHDGRGVGCSCTIDGSTSRRRIASGMYLYIRPRYRARTSFGYMLTILALHHGLAAGYDNLWANTYPDRLSALAIYLSIGCRPVHRTASSFWQWRRVRKRLGPAVEQLKRREQRRNGAAATRASADMPAK
jgi:hypothetical protein